MTGWIARDVEYTHGDTRMRGLLLAAPGAASAPTVVVIHDAFGLGGFSLAEAERYADLGYTVFAADVWGDRATLASPDEIGPKIGGLVGDRGEWMARLAAARDTAAAQPEVDGDRIVMVGYCFGGASALEYARGGGQVRGVVAIHPGLDLLEPGAEWTPRDDLDVLVCVGAIDPMATPAQRESLLSAMDAAGVGWELDLYSGTTHAFTNPQLADSPNPAVFAYEPRSAGRSQRATSAFLAEVLPAPHG
ncbi:dienelactone hydrolase family protein [Microbacterium sp. GXF7504]